MADITKDTDEQKKESRIKYLVVAEEKRVGQSEHRSRWFARPAQSPLKSRPLDGDSLECRMGRQLGRTELMQCAQRPSQRTARL